MSKKLFVLFAIAALLSTGAVFAITPPSTEGVVYENPTGTAIGTATTVVIPVRYGRAGNASNVGWASLSSGDVVVWDSTSADGVTISACITNNDPLYAGVLVTNILTATTGTIDRSDRNWGYIAIRGYCLAKVDTSSSSTGLRLAVLGSTAGDTYGTFGTTAAVNADSVDAGVLLTDTTADGLMPVMLK